MDNTSCLVSVIIPVYNVRPYLEEALSSVIHQTYSDLEIIIIDDGSTDGSGEICDSFAALDRRIVVFHQENRGLSAARNVGLDHAGGDIISFMDPDDAFHPDMIRILMQDIRQFHADIAVCGYTDQTETRPGRHHSRIGVARPARNGRHDPARVIDKREAFIMIADRQIDTAVWNKLYDVAVWNGLRFPDGHVYEGTYTVFDIFNKAERISVRDEKLVLHRIRAGSICRTTSLEIIKDCVTAAERFYNFIKKNCPGTFSFSQYKRLVGIRVRGMTGIYLNYICNYPEDIEGREQVKQMLIRVAKQGMAEGCNLPVLIMSCLVLIFPDFNSKIYNLYKRVRLLVSGVLSG